MTIEEIENMDAMADIWHQTYLVCQNEQMLSEQESEVALDKYRNCN